MIIIRFIIGWIIFISMCVLSTISRLICFDGSSTNAIVADYVGTKVAKAMFFWKDIS